MIDKIKRLLEPKKFKIEQIALFGIFMTSDKRLEIKSIWENNNTDKLSICESVSLINEKLYNLSPHVTYNMKLPIFCLDKVNPEFEGIKAFLIEHISDSFKKDIRCLALQNPISLNFASGKNESGYIIKTVTDISNKRILILGNANKTISYLKNICNVFSLPVDSPEALANTLHNTLNQYIPSNIGSRSLIGGFGAIYALLAAFLINQTLSQKLSQGILFSFILSLFIVICFLCFEAFEDKTIAFVPSWSRNLNLISWFCFIALLFISPFFIFNHISLTMLIPFITIIAIVVILLNLVRSLTAIYFEYGLTKSRVILFWFALLFFIIILRYL